MGHVDLNGLVNGLSGKLGNVVLRQRYGRTFLSQKGKTSAAASEGMLRQRERFKRAAFYAKVSMADPALKQEYATLAKKKDFMTAFSAAVADYLKLPVVSAIRADSYTGLVGDTLAIDTLDDFKITAVSITITDASGTIIESGPATQDATTLQWKYTATQGNATLAGTSIMARAKDRPGNESQLTLTL